MLSSLHTNPMYSLHNEPYRSIICAPILIYLMKWYVYIMFVCVCVYACVHKLGFHFITPVFSTAQLLVFSSNVNISSTDNLHVNLIKYKQELIPSSAPIFLTQLLCHITYNLLKPIIILSERGKQFVVQCKISELEPA